MIAVSPRLTAALRRLLDDAGLGYEPHADLTFEDREAIVIRGSTDPEMDQERPLARAFAS